MNIETYIAEKKIFIEDWLRLHVPSEDLSPSSLYRAMSYSLLAKSKRIRPILALAVTESLGGNSEPVLPFACGLELIHTYSLVHDDLPAMDNDDVRRGQPSNHKVFGEAMAVLAGDALLTHAFFLMSSPQIVSDLPPDLVLHIIHEISTAAGTQGMISGQVMDMEGEGKPISLSQLETMHSRKTGAMILAAIRIGGLVAKASAEQMENLGLYGRHIGLAFQIIDDVLDIEGQPELLGKTMGKDRTSQKATFPSVLGLEESKKLAHQHYEQGVHALGGFGERVEILRDLAKFIMFRKF